MAGADEVSERVRGAFARAASAAGLGSAVAAYYRVNDSSPNRPANGSMARRRDGSEPEIRTTAHADATGRSQHDAADAHRSAAAPPIASLAPAIASSSAAATPAVAVASAALAPTSLTRTPSLAVVAASANESAIKTDAANAAASQTHAAAAAAPLLGNATLPQSADAAPTPAAESVPTPTGSYRTNSNGCSAASVSFDGASARSTSAGTASDAATPGELPASSFAKSPVLAGNQIVRVLKYVVQLATTLVLSRTFVKHNMQSLVAHVKLFADLLARDAQWRNKLLKIAQYGARVLVLHYRAAAAAAASLADAAVAAAPPAAGGGAGSSALATAVGAAKAAMKTAVAAAKAEAGPATAAAVKAANALAHNVSSMTPESVAANANAARRIAVSTTVAALRRLNTIQQGKMAKQLAASYADVAKTLSLARRIMMLGDSITESRELLNMLFIAAADVASGRGLGFEQLLKLAASATSTISGGADDINTLTKVGLLDGKRLPSWYPRFVNSAWAARSLWVLFFGLRAFNASAAALADRRAALLRATAASCSGESVERLQHLHYQVVDAYRELVLAALGVANRACDVGQSFPLAVPELLVPPDEWDVGCGLVSALTSTTRVWLGAAWSADKKARKEAAALTSAAAAANVAPLQVASAVAGPPAGTSASAPASAPAASLPKLVWVSEPCAGSCDAAPAASMAATGSLLVERLVPKPSSADSAVPPGIAASNGTFHRSEAAPASDGKAANGRAIAGVTEK